MFCRAACLMAGGNALGHRKYNAPVKSAGGSAGLSMSAQSQIDFGGMVSTGSARTREYFKPPVRPPFWSERAK